MSFVTETQTLFQQRTGVPASHLLLHATQTHLAPTVISFGAAVAEPAFIERLRVAIVQAAERAIERLEPVTDGYVGYVPTRLAFERGGYETWPAPGSQLAPDAGDQIVASTLDLLERALAERGYH